MIGTWRGTVRRLVLERKQTDAQISTLEEFRNKLNHKILNILERHQKNTITLAGYETSIIRAQSLSLKEKEILRYYKKHKLSPPVREVFDPERFQDDLNNKVVPTSILRKYSTVEERKPYIRITEVKDGS